MEDKKETIKWIFIVVILTVFTSYTINNFFIIEKIGAAIYPFILGGIFAFLLNIPLSFIEKKIFHSRGKKRKIRAISILLSIVFIITIIILINSLISPQLVEAINSMLENLPQTIENVKDIIRNFSNEHQDIGETIINEITNNQDKISSTIQEIIKTMMSYIVGSVKKLFFKVADVIIAMAFACYWLGNREKIYKQLRKVIILYTPKVKHRRIFYLLGIINNSFYNFITAQCKEATILGTLCCIGMLILGLPYALIIGTITMVTALIPILGAWISGIIGFLLILTVNPVKALVFAIFIIVLQQTENNLIYPKVVGKAIKIPSMLILVAITIGGKLFGILGMFLGVPLISIIYIVFMKDTSQRIRRKQSKHTLCDGKNI